MTIAETPTQPGRPGWGISAKLGFHGIGFNLDQQCQVQLLEPDEHSWNAMCSALPATSCVITNPRVLDGAVTFALQCRSMPPIAQPSGRNVDVASASSATAPIDIRVVGCTGLTP